MKKISDLMKELGFNPNAPQQTGEAFVKHLIKASEGINTATPTEKMTIQASKNVHSLGANQQLTFDDFLNQNKDKKAVG